MPRWTDLTGLAGAVAALAALTLALPGIARLRRRSPALLLAAVAALALIPLGALPAAAYVRGVLGDLSVTSMVLLLRALLRPLFRWPPLGAENALAVQALAVVGALVLYPPVLGLGWLDPYRWGYGGQGFVVAVLLLAAAAWLLRLHLAASCIALAVLAHAVGWYESRNLWDYLLDPLVSAWGLVALGFRAAKAAGAHSGRVGLSPGRSVAGPTKESSSSCRRDERAW